MKHPGITIILCVAVLLLVVIVVDHHMNRPPIKKWRDLYINLLQNEEYEIVAQRLAIADHNEKIGCVMALSRVELSDRAGPILTMLAKDRSLAIRKLLCGSCLGGLRPEIATDALRILAEDTDDWVKETAASCLAEHGLEPASLDAPRDEEPGAAAAHSAVTPQGTEGAHEESTPHD